MSCWGGFGSRTLGASRAGCDSLLVIRPWGGMQTSQEGWYCRRVLPSDLLLVIQVRPNSIACVCFLLKLVQACRLQPAHVQAPSRAQTHGVPSTLSGLGVGGLRGGDGSLESWADAVWGWLRV